MIYPKRYAKIPTKDFGTTRRSFCRVNRFGVHFLGLLMYGKVIMMD